MDKEREYCHAFKFKNEAAGMCCASGKVVLPTLNPPPEPLKTFMSGVTRGSKLFLKKIRKFNSCFQMTSSGATNIVQNTSNDGRNVETTFKIQGQIYHQIGSLLPMLGEDPKFLQIYFMGDEEEQVNIRCNYNHIEENEQKTIVASLETFLKKNNHLLKLFKQMSNRLKNYNYMVVIKADEVLAGEHARRFNAPTINEIAIVMVGVQFHKRDIKIIRRDNTLQTIPDTHRSYDALQYPLIFWEGEDGYQINIKQRNPSTGEETNKSISAMNYYSYRLMIRRNEANHILKCRQLFHQYVVDMYAKIESERLRYIRFNQAKLRSEEYIRLRDAVNNNIDGNLNINDIGNVFILPSSYTGSPRHMQEYIQDAMIFVRAYGRPDLFITFTCNPQWDEIKKLLLPGQTTIYHHDITARVFKQKLESLIDLIVKYHDKKIGSYIILLRNLNAPRLCNGTRLVIRKIMGNVIKATILNGKFRGDNVLLPRIPTDAPMQFKRLQFPIRLAFAMTINKSQGQTMIICGLDLENSCFSHGQLYVACLSVGKPSNHFIYAPDGLTKNIAHELGLR